MDRSFRKSGSGRRSRVLAAVLGLLCATAPALDAAEAPIRTTGTAEIPGHASPATRGEPGTGPVNAPDEEFPNEEVLQRLDDQIWKWIAEEAPSAPVESPRGRGTGSLRAERARLASEMARWIGPLPGRAAGTRLDGDILYDNGVYRISWVRLASRLPWVSVFGYLAHPVRPAVGTPAVILLHGAGVPPHTAFGWRLEADDPFVKFDGPSPLSETGLALLEAGYTVFVPWLSDSRPICEIWNTCERSGRANGAAFEWFELDRWGAWYAAKKGGRGSAYSILLPGLQASIDFLDRLDWVDKRQIAVAGWKEGAEVAGVLAAVDRRVSALVWLGPPLDRISLHRDPTRIRSVAAFTLSDGPFGQAELATLVSPRPLLFSYSAGESQNQDSAPYISDSVFSRILEIYRKSGAPHNATRLVLGDRPSALGRAPLQWLNDHFRRSSSHARAWKGPPPQPNPQEWPYPQKQYDAIRDEIARYLVTLPSPPRRRRDFGVRTPAAIETAAASIRKELLVRLAGGSIGLDRPVEVLGRRILSTDPGYRLEWVEFRARLKDVVIGGFLATPEDGQTAHPAVVSFNLIENPSWLFGQHPEPTPYLNAYGRELARSGHVVFAPYLSGIQIDGWGAILRAKSAGRRGLWSLLLPFFASGVDFVSREAGVDRTRIAAYGLSFGGVAALLTTALDERIKALVYSNSLLEMRESLSETRMALSPIWQIEIVRDLNDAQEFLIAPRRFVWETGDPPEKAFDGPLVVPPVEDTYRLLGRAQRFTLVRHLGKHQTFGLKGAEYYEPPGGADIFLDR